LALSPVVRIPIRSRLERRGSDLCIGFSNHG